MADPFDPHADPTMVAPVRRGGRRPPPNSANEREQATLEAEQRKRDARNRLDLRHLSTLPEFQRFAADLIDGCGVFVAPRVFSAEKQVLEGRREIGLWLFDRITQVNPSVLPLLLPQPTLSETPDDE